MAKALGPKSRIIRAALAAHPGMKNIELAETINHLPESKAEGITVTAMDVAAQKQAMKKPGAEKVAPGRGTAARKKPGRKPKATSAASTSSAKQVNAVDLIDGVLTLAKKAGGVAELKRLVDRIAETGETIGGDGVLSSADLAVAQTPGFVGAYRRNLLACLACVRAVIAPK